MYKKKEEKKSFLKSKPHVHVVGSGNRCMFHIIVNEINMHLANEASINNGNKIVLCHI